MRALLAMALIGCGGRAAEPAATPAATTTAATATVPAAVAPAVGNVPAPAGPPATAQLAGWGALVIGERAFVIAPGFGEVVAYAPASGRELWRVRLPEETGGRHSLHALAGKVGLWAGNRLIVLDPVTGKLVRKPDEVPWNDRCWLDSVGGACGMRCDCDFRVVDCATGLAVGPVYDKSYVEFFDEEGGGSGGCYGGGGDLLGRAGAAAVFSIEDTAGRGPGHELGGPLAFAAVDLRSGRQLYTLPAAPLTSTVAPAASGISADGRTCWAGDHEARLLAWDCATGRPLWSRPGLSTSAPHGLPGHVVQSIAGAIFVRTGETATLLDERTGAARWTQRVPPTRATLLAGAAAPRMVGLGLPSEIRTTELAWLDPADGRERTVWHDVELVDETDDGGLLVRTAGLLVAIDRDGREVARATESVPANVTVAPDHLDAFGDDFALLDRGLRVRLRLAGTVASAPGSTLAALALYRWPPKGTDGPGEILLYSLRP